MNKINSIIDALYKVELLFEAHGQYPHTLREVSEALAAARELKALKPVAWVTRGTFSGRFQLCNSDDIGAFPVYALDDEVKHD